MNDIENNESVIGHDCIVSSEKNVGELSVALLQIGLTCSSHVTGGSGSAGHADLYGEDGLPKQASQ